MNTGKCIHSVHIAYNYVIAFSFNGNKPLKPFAQEKNFNKLFEIPD
jgi:hypothetical protein